MSNKDEDKFLTDPFDCYLTEKAREVIKIMREAGMDKDLALVTLESLWNEESIYEL